MPETKPHAIAAHKSGLSLCRDAELLVGSLSRPRLHSANGSDSNGTTRRYRCRLFTLNPHCYWCGRLTVWDTPSNGTLSPDSATTDHVVSKYNRSWNSPTDLVLACYECNQRRSQNETEARVEARRQAGFVGNELGQ